MEIEVNSDLVDKLAKDVEDANITSRDAINCLLALTGIILSKANTKEGFEKAFFSYSEKLILAFKKKTDANKPKKGKTVRVAHSPFH